MLKRSNYFPGMLWIVNSKYQTIWFRNIMVWENWLGTQSRCISEVAKNLHWYLKIIWGINIKLKSRPTQTSLSDLWCRWWRLVASSFCLLFWNVTCEWLWSMSGVLPLLPTPEIEISELMSTSWSRSRLSLSFSRSRRKTTAACAITVFVVTLMLPIHSFLFHYSYAKIYLGLIWISTGVELKFQWHFILSLLK